MPKTKTAKERARLSPQRGLFPDQARPTLEVADELGTSHRKLGRARRRRNISLLKRQNEGLWGVEEVNKKSCLSESRDPLRDLHQGKLPTLCCRHRQEAMSDRGVKQAGKLGNYRRRRDNDPAFSQILQSARLPGLHVDTSLPEYTIDSQT